LATPGLRSVSLSAAEQQIWDAFPLGERVELPPDGESGPLARAEVLRALLLGAHPGEAGYLPSLWVKGAHITGQLNLMHAEIESAIALHACVFAEKPELSWARLRTVELEGCLLPGLEAFSGDSRALRHTGQR
jgi:hypothetical protein